MGRTVAGMAARLTARGRSAQPAKEERGGTGRRLVLVGVPEVTADDFLAAAGEDWSGPQSVVSGTDPALAGGRSEWDEIVVVADSVAQLRLVVPWLGRVGRARRLVLSAVATDRPDLLGVPGGLRRVERRRVDPAGVLVTVESDEPVSARDLARRVLDPGRPAGRCAPAAGLRLGLTTPEVLAWAAGDVGAALVGPRTELVRPVEHEQFDLLVGPAVPDLAPEPRVPRLEFGAGLALPPVDTAVISPAGYTRDTTADLGQVELDAARLTVLGSDGTAIGAGDVRAGLTENHIAALRGLGGVQFVPAGNASTLHAGRVLTQVACAGVPVRPFEPTADLAAALGPELTARFAVDWDPSDPYGRESWSLQTRRIALTRFAPELYWSRVGAEHGRPCVTPPTVSVLLPTRRPDFVSFALSQVQRQDWPNLEVVLILHGVSADEPSVRRAVSDFGRPLEIVEVADDVLFGDALNAGTARCSGRLVTKMDDDDWYGPHHVTDLVLARVYSGATMVGLAGYHVYLHRSDATIRRTTRTTEAPASWLAGPTMLLGTEDLRSLGGWRSVPGAVDFHLLASVRGAGGSLYGIHDLGFLYYRGGHGHTWAADNSDEEWLARAAATWPGFRPPPQVDPLPHPLFGG